MYSSVVGMAARLPYVGSLIQRMLDRLGICASMSGPAAEQMHFALPIVPRTLMKCATRLCGVSIEMVKSLQYLSAKQIERQHTQTYHIHAQK